MLIGSQMLSVQSYIPILNSLPSINISSPHPQEGNPRVVSINIFSLSRISQSASQSMVKVKKTPNHNIKTIKYLITLNRFLTRVRKSVLPKYDWHC